MLNNDEIWKDMVGFEGRYQVSNHGRVRSIFNNRGKYQEKIKTQRTRSKICEYLYVQLSILDKTYHEAVHRAVAKAFIPNPDNKPMVNHLDGVKLNNNASNLEWVTCSENHLHAYQIDLKSSEELIKSIKGKKWGNSSSYFNVTWDRFRERWIASMKDKRKTVFQKRFKHENDAARYVNEKLDELGYTDRPRNIIIEMPNDYPERE